MPPTLEEIKIYLHDELGPHVSDASSFEQWLNGLFDHDNVFNHLLGINLYIDLKTGALERDTVIQILNSMTPLDDARLSFYQYVEQEDNQSFCVCQHRGSAQGISDDRYVRVLPLTSMIEYYFRAATTLPADLGEAENEVERLFYNSDPGSRTQLGVIRNVWRGGMENVWVTSKTALDDIINSDIPDDEKACLTRDRLGLYELDDGRLVYVVYPPDFDFVEAFVPTTLDASSTSYFFAATGMTTETWGMTCSLNHKCTGMLERVHKAFVGLTDDFGSEIIGYLTEAGEPDPNHLLEVALNRVP